MRVRVIIELHGKRQVDFAVIVVLVVARGIAKVAERRRWNHVCSIGRYKRIDVGAAATTATAAARGRDVRRVDGRCYAW